MLRGWMPPSLFVIRKVWSTAAAIGWTIPRGPMEIAKHIAWRYSSWLTHSCFPEAWNLRQYCFIFLHNTDSNMLCRLFDDRKYMDIYISPHTSGILLSWKTKNLFVFFLINLWTLDPFTFTHRKLFKLTNRQHLYWVCANILHSFLSLLNFKVNFLKI